MTIFINAQTLEDLSSYSGLLRAIASWLDREDLADRIPYFIQLAEARFRRVIRNPERETDVAIVPGESITLPADFDSMRMLRIPELHGAMAIDPVSPVEFYSRQRLSGERPAYTIMNGQLRLSPLPASLTAYTGFLTYMAGVTALTPSAPINWLLAEHPDLYLFGALLQAEFFGWNDDRLPLIKGAVDEALGELAEAGMRKRYGSGPLVMRSAVHEPARGAYRR